MQGEDAPQPSSVGQALRTQETDGRATTLVDCPEHQVPLRLILLLLLWPATAAAQAADGNVVLIMLDGVRWQEVFTGADSLLMYSEHGGIGDTATARRQFGRATAEERRRVLMPFLWDSVAPHGQILGDAAHGSVARVTNGFN